MSNTQKPELLYKIRTEDERGVKSFQYLTKEQAATRGLLQEVLNIGEENAYVRISAQVRQSYRDWKRDQKYRGK